MCRLAKKVEVTGHGVARQRQMVCGLMVAVGFGLLMNDTCVSAELDANSIMYQHNYDNLLVSIEHAGNAVAWGHAARRARLGKTYQKSEGFEGLNEHKFGDETQVRGWEVLPKTYVGQTKVLDSWGVGIVIEKDDYVFGINNRRLSIGTRF
jgi:hypothetical protein